MVGFHLRSGRLPDWLKMKNPARSAAGREAVAGGCKVYGAACRLITWPMLTRLSEITPSPTHRRIPSSPLYRQRSRPFRRSTTLIAPLAAGRPFLAVAEPALLLLAFAFEALGRTIGKAHAFDAQRLRRCLVPARIECEKPCALPTRRRRQRCVVNLIAARHSGRPFDPSQYLAAVFTVIRTRC